MGSALIGCEIAVSVNAAANHNAGRLSLHQLSSAMIQLGE